MIHVVPCTPAGASAWTQRTALDGTDYLLAFDWNGRMGRWTLSLADATGVAIRSGVVLNARTVLLRGVVDPRRPPGELTVVDTLARHDLDPGFSDLGARFQLQYLDAAELGR